ncbi:MAG: alcohol dehydrogenase catalytic domain-containing protein [Actinomycetia bacterium]|nr:alcohol dehydrogenase catalytic domain-containing protein [Actinomycetes bacterium]
MRAIGIDADHELQMFEMPGEPVGPDQALIRTTRVGICGTDREIVRTGAPFRLPTGEGRLVLGHEASWSGSVRV